MNVIHDPGGLGFRIEHIWAYLAIHEDGDEGVVAMTVPGQTAIPLIAADETRLQAITPVARRIARMSGKPVQLVRFDVRTDLERFEP